MIDVRYSWCEPKDERGEWFHVTDATGESLGYVVKRGPRDWLAVAESGSEGSGTSRQAAMKNAAFS